MTPRIGRSAAVIRRLVSAVMAVALLVSCARHESAQRVWTDDEVTFEADGLTLHGTYRHLSGDGSGPAALLISESGATDRNGWRDNFMFLR